MVNGNGVKSEIFDERGPEVENRISEYNDALLEMMHKHIPWTERRFTFDTPAGLYPELIERLRGAPFRARALVSECQAEILSHRDGRKWSIQEHIGHLAELDQSLFLVRVKELAAGAETLLAADMTNRTTEIAEFNRYAITKIIKMLEDSRLAVIKTLQALQPEEFARRALHPRLKQPMRLIDMMFFHAEHDDYHFARAREMTLGKPANEQVHPTEKAAGDPQRDFHQRKSINPKENGWNE